MNIKFKLFICAYLISATHHSLAASSSKEIEISLPILLSGAVTEIKEFSQQGDPALIIRGHGFTGTAGGNTNTYLILMPNPAVLSEAAKTTSYVVSVGDQDTLSDYPHTGEDCVSVVLFGRGTIEGRAATLAVKAERIVQGGFQNPGPVTFSAYELQLDDLAGYQFISEKKWVSKKKYANSADAMRDEFHLSETYQAICQ